jgi:hypothetical protein
VERRKQARGRHQRFIGSWARLNCENMPVIPAWLVRRCLDDPRRIPYLLVWKDDRHDGKIMEAVRLAHFTACGREANDYVELKRTDGSTTVLRIVWRMLPRYGGRALFMSCPHCETPHRFVYGWEWDSFSGWSNSVRQVPWCCRSCNRLRYSSEGGYLRQSGRGKLAALFRRAFGNLPRPESWLPYVFTSIDDPGLDEIIGAEFHRIA